MSMAWVGGVKAIDARSAEDITTKPDAVIDSSSFQAGSKVSVDGLIKGDLFCAGQDVVVNGTVQGDVLCAAQTITIKGTVRGDVRVAAQVVTIEGAVDGSVTMLGQRGSIHTNATIGRDLTVLGQSAHIDGKIGRDVVAAGETVSIRGEVGRNVEAFAEQMSVSAAKIGGNFIYTSDKPVVVGESATVLGATQHKVPPADQRPQETFFSRYIAGPAYWFIALFLIGLALLWLTPKLLTKTDHAIRVHPFLALGAGALVVILGPLLVVALVASVVGLPLALVIGSLWLAALIASFTFSGYTLGLLLTMRQKKWNVNWWQKSLSLLAGLFVLMALSMVPVLGGLVLLLAILWGIGSLTLAGFQLSNRKKKSAK